MSFLLLIKNIQNFLKQPLVLIDKITLLKLSLSIAI